MVDSGHWRSIVLFKKIMVMVLNNIFYEYALLIGPRDTIFGMYTHMNARNDIIYIHLHSMVTSGQ